MRAWQKDQDLVVFGGQSTPTVVRSRGSRIKNCLLDGGARSRPTAESNDFSGKDGVDTGQATGTTSFAEDQAIVIDNTQIRHNDDRGVKSQNAYVLVRDSWIHNNLRGGAFALQPRGRIKTEHTVLEANGKNASGASTHLAADQMSAQAASAASDGTYLESYGSLLRNGQACGLFLRQNSTGMIRNTWICGMVENGIELTSNAGAVTFRGTASVRNQRGVLMNQMSGVVAPADFGIGAQAGGNVFTKNTLVVGNAFLNFRVAGGATTSTQVQGNQWEHCGNGQTCNITASGGILEKDVVGNVTITTAQAHRDPGPIQIDDSPPGGILEGIHPRSVANPGDLVHIHGSGFNAIEGYEPGSVSCNNLGNSCFPLQGTCVEFKDASGLFQPAEVVAITPRYIAVRAPFACSRPADIRIKRRDHLGGSVLFEKLAAF